MRLETYVVIAASLVAMSGCQKSGGGAPQTAPDAQQAASNAIGTLQKLVTEQNYKTLGFNSLDEVKTAALAPPLTMFNIGLDRLKAYGDGQDANGLLTASSETIYPVTAGGQVRSSVTVVKQAAGYATASFGNAAIVQGLARYRNAPDAFVVRVPALSLYFLGSRIEGRLMLTPVVIDSRIPLRVGLAVPADEVLKLIGPLAQAYNGLPM